MIGRSLTRPPRCRDPHAALPRRVLAKILGLTRCLVLAVRCWPCTTVLIAARGAALSWLATAGLGPGGARPGGRARSSWSPRCRRWWPASSSTNSPSRSSARSIRSPRPAGRCRSARRCCCRVRFALLSLAVMVVALVLLLVPGVNAVAFLGANAYLLGPPVFRIRGAAPPRARGGRGAAPPACGLALRRPG